MILLLYISISSLLIQSISSQQCFEFKRESACTKSGCIWFNEGCCKLFDDNGNCIKRYDDGGCKEPYFCDFKCEAKCRMNKNNGCAWNGNTCISLSIPDYETNSGIVEEADGLLIYSPPQIYGPNLGLKTYDTICQDNKLIRCSIGYFSAAMMCQEGVRDLYDLPEILSTKPKENVYGPNGKYIGSLSNIISSTFTLSSSLKEAGVNIAGDMFWSGCSKSGDVDSLEDVSCSNWNSKSQNSFARCGNISKKSSSELKSWVKKSCDQKLNIMCLCQRAKLKKNIY